MLNGEKRVRKKTSNMFGYKILSCQPMCGDNNSID